MTGHSPPAMGDTRVMKRSGTLPVVLFSGLRRTGVGPQWTRGLSGTRRRGGRSVSEGFPLREVPLDDGVVTYPETTLGPELRPTFLGP